MSESNVIQLAQPGVFTDCLTEILRSGARSLLTKPSKPKLPSFSQRMPISYTKVDYFREIESAKPIWPDLNCTPPEILIETVTATWE